MGQAKKDKKEYGSEYQSHILEMYKLHTEMADRVSHRRGVMNNLYITGNTALIALLASLYSTTSDYVNFIPAITLTILGMLISVIWYKNILSYKQLNSSKFKALDQLEKELPLAFYKIEYDDYKNKKRKDFSDIEKNIPIILGVAYALYLIFNIYRLPSL